MTLQSTISKSQYLKGLQCPLALWYYRNRKELQPRIDAATQMRFDAGKAVGSLAQNYFSGGVKIIEKYWDISKAARATQRLIVEQQHIIFEATAIHPRNGSYARVDILRKAFDADKWDLIEVKSSTGKKSYHIDDVAFQYNVFSSAGYEINDCLLMLLDSDYLRQGDINPVDLFRLESIYDDVLAQLNSVEVASSELIRIVDEKQEPRVTIGARCFQPFECEYRYHCWQHVPDFSIYNIYSKTQADEVFAKTGSYDVSDIPTDLVPNNYKAIDVRCYKSKKEHIEKDKIQAFLEDLEYPLRYLDYETLMSALPLYDGTRPYQQIPFQFSLHVQNEPGAAPQHYEFIHKKICDPRAAFIDRLLELAGSDGSILVYNQSFEINRNKELARDFTEFAEELEAINDRVIDLMEPFAKRWLYKSEQSGSHSIKNVLPAYIPELSYKDLRIARGEDAMVGYIKYVQGVLSGDEANGLWRDLSRYCELDTFAMVRLVEVLQAYAK